MTFIFFCGWLVGCLTILCCLPFRSQPPRVVTIGKDTPPLAHPTAWREGWRDREVGERL